MMDPPNAKEIRDQPPHVNEEGGAGGPRSAGLASKLHHTVVPPQPGGLRVYKLLAAGGEFALACEFLPGASSCVGCSCM